MTTALILPEIGAEQAEVIEILVKEGSVLDTETPVMTLEGEKATMEVPAGVEGTVTSLTVSVGDKLKPGDTYGTFEGKASSDHEARSDTVTAQSEASTMSAMAWTLPDFGATEATVIERLVAEGESFEAEQALLTLEGEKATMEVPAPCAGVMTAWLIDVQAKVTPDQHVADLMVKAKKQPDKKQDKPTSSSSAPRAAKASGSVTPSRQAIKATAEGQWVYAGPASRRFAHTFGVDLTRVAGSGEKGRVQPDDVLAYIRAQLAIVQGQAAPAAQASTAPSVQAPTTPACTAAMCERDGPITVKPLSKLKQYSGKHLLAAWQGIPHVTQHASADITVIENVRQSLKAEGIRISPLMIVLKTLVESLKAFPAMNASLDTDTNDLILKSFYHIGVAVDTPQGLVVPVIRDVDQLSLLALNDAVTARAEQARTKGLPPEAMKGGTFTVSSLGGIGGTAFTPIVNAPEVAILGLSRSAMTPVWLDDEWTPRLMLPLALSYDHRVIDGAEGARFVMDLVQRLEALTEDTIKAWCQKEETS